MKTFDQILEELNETNATRAVSIAARLKGPINRLKKVLPRTSANKIQNLRSIGEDELGPEGQRIENAKRKLGIKESDSFSSLLMKRIGANGSSGVNMKKAGLKIAPVVPKKGKKMKEAEGEDDIEYALRSKAPMKEDTSKPNPNPKPEPKKVNRLKYFLARAIRNQKIGEENRPK